MLVLSRKKNEEVVITLPDGTRGYVAVADIRGDKVRLGFKFADDVTVHRMEVQSVIDGEQDGRTTIRDARTKP